MKELPDNLNYETITSPDAMHQVAKADRDGETVYFYRAREGVYFGDWQEGTVDNWLSISGEEVDDVPTIAIVTEPEDVAAQATVESGSVDHLGAEPEYVANTTAIEDAHLIEEAAALLEADVADIVEEMGLSPKTQDEIPGVVEETEVEPLEGESLGGLDYTEDSEDLEEVEQEVKELLDESEPLYDPDTPIAINEPAVPVKVRKPKK